MRSNKLLSSSWWTACPSHMCPEHCFCSKLVPSCRIDKLQLIWPYGIRIWAYKRAWGLASLPLSSRFNNQSMFWTHVREPYFPLPDATLLCTGKFSVSKPETECVASFSLEPGPETWEKWETSSLRRDNLLATPPWCLVCKGNNLCRVETLNNWRRVNNTHRVVKSKICRG